MTAAEGVRSTLAIDLALFGIAFLAWKVLNIYGQFPLQPRRSKATLCESLRMAFCGLPAQIGEEYQSTAHRNYVAFLQQTRDLFIALTVISALFTGLRWGPSPITVGVVGGGPLSTTAGGVPDAWGLWLLGLNTFLCGAVALVFVERLSKRIKRPNFTTKEEECIQRTLWFTGLPAYDHGTGQPFLFERGSLDRVTEDLSAAIAKHIEENTIGMFTDPVISVQVIPVVNRLWDVCRALRTVHERKVALFDLMNVYQPSRCLGKMRCKMYQMQFHKCEGEELKLQEELEALSRGPRRISGSAFVTFASREHRDIFLRDRPGCIDSITDYCRSHAYFRFGVPPFASVTLACTRACHPNDVKWNNLHVTKKQQAARSIVLVILLIATVIVLTMPITWSADCRFNQLLRRHFIRLAARLRVGAGLTMAICHAAPASFLVLVNAVILPELIARLVMAVQPHRTSLGEILQWHLNFLFLLLNTMVIPFLGVSGIGSAYEVLREEVSDDRPFDDFGQRCIHRLLHAHGIFALRYLISSACLTNMSSMMQVPQILCRAVSRCGALTLREKVDCEERFAFAWGYWYAWAMSAFTIALCMSSIIPGTLPCAALFFCFQYMVDNHNLKYGYYDHGKFEAENQLAVRSLHYMRCIIAAWWLLMGLTFAYLCRQLSVRGEWDAPVPMWSMQYLSAALIVLSVCLVPYSWGTQHYHLHQSNFETVDLEKSQSLLGGTRCCRWAIRGVDAVKHWASGRCGTRYDHISRVESVGGETPRAGRSPSGGQTPFTRLARANATLLSGESPEKEEPVKAKKQEPLDWYPEIVSFIERRQLKKQEIEILSDPF